jgi:hypothetical protein
MARRPVIDMFQGEASLAMKRILSIMASKRLVPPMPRSLAGVPMQIKYTGMLYVAQ